VDQLLESNLIEMEAGGKPGIIKAAPIANLKILIAQKELDIVSLRDELELIEQTLHRTSLSNPITKLQQYYGRSGAMQLLEEIKRYEGLICSYETLPMLSILGEAEAKLYFSKTINSNTTLQRLATSKVQIADQKQLKTATAKANNTLKTLDSSHGITNNIYLYDNSIVTITIQNTDIYATKIVDDSLYSLQLAHFQAIWNSSALF
jgi:hypothetical protein